MKAFVGNWKKTKLQIREYIGKISPKEHNWAEFGVCRGNSARIWLKYLPLNKKLYLFDSFEGLPEKWGELAKGHFKCDIPEFNDKRAVIVKGLFQNTLPTWAKRYKGKLSFVHLDADLYSSTKLILDNIYPFLNNKTILLFDQFAGTALHKNHERRAFLEFINEHKFNFQYIAHTPHFRCVAVKAFRILMV